MSKKIKKVFNKPSLINEWNDTSFKDLPKRWTGAYGRKNGLTEFEDYCGGKDNIKLGKLYTDKDRPPFATNKQIQELKLQEEFAIDDEGWNSVKGMVKGFFEDLQNVTNSIKGKNLKDLYGVLDNINRRQLGIKSVLKKHMKTDDDVSEGLKRFKVYIKGESKPLILTGKNERDVKQLAHAMINNNSIKIAKVVKEGKLSEGKWAVINANDVLNVFAVKVVNTQQEAEKIAKQMKQKDKYGKYQAVDVKRWNQAKPNNKIKEGKLTEGRPRGYAEEIAQDLVKKKQVKKGMSEDKIIDAIFKWLKKNDRNKNRVRWLMSYDEDFLSDTISAINNSLKEGKLTEGKRVKYRKNDWKKYNQLVKRGKSVMVQTAFGDQFAWEDGSNYGVFASEESGREIELDHDDIDMVEIF